MHPSKTGPRWQSLVDRLRTTLRIVVAWIATDIRRRRGRAQLARLDDHLLRDIGLTRCDIERNKGRVFRADR